MQPARISDGDTLAGSPPSPDAVSMLSACTAARRSQRGSTPYYYYVDEVPPWVRSAWRATSTRLARDLPRPELHVLEHANGSGGFFQAGQDVDIIAVGIDDLRDIAAEMMSRLPRANVRAVSRGCRVVMHDEVLTVAATLLLGHELGHLIELERDAADGTIAEEWRADRWAGEFAERAGLDPQLGALFFQVLGCTDGPLRCTHPDPQARVNAYLQGRARAVARVRPRVAAAYGR